MRATDKESWWTVSPSPLLDVQADEDVFRPAHTRGELVDEFGSAQVSTALRIGHPRPSCSFPET
ncbi:hypothetical protein [Rhodococcus sp. NPDC047139]|uniref:hypothetical protein n=1 Tax=Rhodococcus sp. NPDC047139 TaxID=3155141 RepID=UPI0033C52D4D